MVILSNMSGTMSKSCMRYIWAVPASPPASICLSVISHYTDYEQAYVLMQYSAIWRPVPTVTTLNAKQI